MQTDQKAAMARAAAALVHAGESVAISAGTCSQAVTMELSSIPNLTVVTNSVPVGELLHSIGRDDLTVLLTGGIRTASDALVGPVAVAALGTLHVDWLILGAHAVDERAGLTTSSLIEAETDRAFIRCARRVAVVADSTKWGVVGLSSIARLTEVDVMISDEGLAPDARRVLQTQVGRLVITPSAPTLHPSRNLP